MNLFISVIDWLYKPSALVEFIDVRYLCCKLTLNEHALSWCCDFFHPVQLELNPFPSSVCIFPLPVWCLQPLWSVQPSALPVQHSTVSYPPILTMSPNQQLTVVPTALSLSFLTSSLCHSLCLRCVSADVEEIHSWPLCASHLHSRAFLNLTPSSFTLYCC